jgi:hypothetical protein
MYKESIDLEVGFKGLIFGVGIHYHYHHNRRQPSSLPPPPPPTTTTAAVAIITDSFFPCLCRE